MNRQTHFALVVGSLVLAAGLLCLPAACPADNTEEVQQIEKEMITGGNYQEAADKLEGLLAASPRDARIYLDLGLAQYGLMRYAEAYKNFKKAEQLGAPRAISDLLWYAISTVDKNKALLEQMEDENNMFQAATGGTKDKLRIKLAGAHFAVLNSLMGKKYYYASILVPHILWLKNNLPEQEGLTTMLADVYYSAMFYRQAIEHYKEALREAPDDIRLYKTLGDCQIATGDYDSAQENYNKAIKLYEEEGLTKSAPQIKHLETVKRALPKKYKDVSDLMRKKRLTEAAEICKKRISLNPADYVALTQLGQIYWQQQKKKHAVKYFKRAIKIAPDYPTAHFFLGRAYFLERRFDKGIAEFDVFREKMDILPKMDEDTKASYVEQLNYIGYLYTTRRQYEKALKLFNQAVELKPDDQKSYYNQAVCYYVHYHNRSRAYSALQKVLEIDPDTKLADKAKYYIDYIRRNPDVRSKGDFSFIYDYSE